MSYGSFAAMIATSTIVMFGLMYTRACWGVEYSQTRTWMAVVMGAAMALIMISFMWRMYPNRRANIGIVIGAVIVFAAAMWLVRSQETVDDGRPARLNGTYQEPMQIIVIILLGRVAATLSPP